LVVLAAHHERNLMRGDMVELTVYSPFTDSFSGPQIRLHSPPVRGYHAFVSVDLHPAMLCVYLGVKAA